MLTGNYRRCLSSSLPEALSPGDQRAPGVGAVHFLTGNSCVLRARPEPFVHYMPAGGLSWAVSKPVSLRTSGLTPSLPAVSLSSWPVTDRFSAF
jgi:hypothetical protein